MLVDLDYFYAKCEERRNPSFKGKPVVVCVYSGRTEDSGVVSTANYLAREHGVNSGIPISVAKSRLRGLDAVFLPVDHPFYDEMSEKVMTVLRDYADRPQQGRCQVGEVDTIPDSLAQSTGGVRLEGPTSRATVLHIGGYPVQHPHYGVHLAQRPIGQLLSASHYLGIVRLYQVF